MSLLTNKEKAQCIVAGLAAAFALTFVIEALATVIFMPEVQVSHSTGECVKVINFRIEDTWSCDNLPSKYNHVWVK